MQSIHHPCLVHLKAWNIEPTRAILVLSHCPGGDLFDVASKHRDLLLSASLLIILAVFWGQLTSYSRCLGAANTLTARHACLNQLNHSVNGEIGRLGGGP